MATRKIRIRGYNHAVNSAATVTFDGVEIFSGALSAEGSRRKSCVDYRYHKPCGNI